MMNNNTTTMNKIELAALLGSEVNAYDFFKEVEVDETAELADWGRDYIVVIADMGEECLTVRAHFYATRLDNELIVVWLEVEGMKGDKFATEEDAEQAFEEYCWTQYNEYCIQRKEEASLSQWLGW